MSNSLFSDLNNYRYKAMNVHGLARILRWRDRQRAINWRIRIIEASSIANAAKLLRSSIVLLRSLKQRHRSAMASYCCKP